MAPEFQTSGTIKEIIRLNSLQTSQGLYIQTICFSAIILQRSKESNGKGFFRSSVHLSLTVKSSSAPCVLIPCCQYRLMRKKKQKNKKTGDKGTSFPCLAALEKMDDALLHHKELFRLLLCAGKNLT